MGKTNATLSAEGFGTAYFYVREMGYGTEVVYTESESARERSFYPKLHHSQLYVDTVWPNRFIFMAFQAWMASYISRIASPSFRQPPPMVFSLPSQGFIKQGFPKSPVSFGDKWNAISYTARLEFSSSSDIMEPIQSSKYVGPGTGLANLFYPGGFQSGDAVDPVTTPFTNPNEGDPIINYPTVPRW